jgi:hypothetical protein
VYCRPCRYQEGVFACYNGFVPDLDDLGRPLADYTPSLSAWPHLAALMAKCHASVASMTAPPRPVPSEHTMFSPKRHVVPPTSTPVTIIGFSKGTVVLNQLLLELPLLQSSPRSKLIDSIYALVNRVCCVHFLDGIGHTRLVPASLLPPSALQGPLVTPPSVSPLSSSFLKASETPKDLDSVSDVPWYHTLPVVVTPIPTVDSPSSTIAVTTLSLPLLPHRCVFMIHGTPYQWCDSDAERAVRKPQALWLHSQLEEQGFTSHILVPAVRSYFRCCVSNCPRLQEYYKGDERDSDSIVKHHFKLLFDFKLRPDSA